MPESNSDSIKTKKKGIFSFLWAHKILTVFLMLLAFGSGFYYVKLTQVRQTGLEVGFFDPFRNVVNVIAPPAESALSKLEKDNGRTNILLLGVDARKTDDSYLTDSIQVLSFDHAKKEVAQISIPRDVNVKAQIHSGWNYEGKINAVFPFTYNEELKKTKDTDKALKKAFENLGNAVEYVTDLKIQYGTLVNFRGFKEIVDTIGGITVEVDNAFTDAEFPKNDDTGYQVVSFQKGSQQMNGDKALQYARSRHGNNGEGSDYARARRQQKVIQAIKTKVSSSNLFGKADTLNQLITTLGKNIRFYNIGSNEIDVALKARDALNSAPIYSMVIDPEFGGTPGALLVGQSIEGDPRGFVVEPKGKSYDDVKETIEYYFSNSFLLKETPRAMTVWTNAKRYKDFTNLKLTLKESKYKFVSNEPQIRVATPTISGTQNLTTPTVTKKTSVTPTLAPTDVTIYELNTEKKTSLEFYKSLLNKEGNFTVLVKSKSDMPKELEKISKEQDFLMVIE